MSAHDVQSDILEPMQRLYLPPRNMDEGQQTAALREYVNALCNFDGGDLKASWSAVRDTHTTRSWPVPAAFIIAAKQARKDRAADAKPASKPLENEAWDMWKRVRTSQLGMEAARRGVSWALKCAVLDDKKRPEEIDLRAFVIAKASAERLAAKLESGEFVMREGDREIALKMWRNLLTRNAETEAEILGRAA